MTRFLVTGANGFIGTNLILSFRTNIKTPYSVVLVDTADPKISLQENETWSNIDLLDEKAIYALFERYKPEMVIHLAALTSTAPELLLEDYKANTKGAEILFEACEKNQIDFLVHTSTQFVNQAPGYPSSDTDYAPHTIYGTSKVISEQLLREERFHFNWCIIRPTNIWGPFHLRYPYEFWKVLKEGKYLHPGRKKVVRSYGYVGNICWQIMQLIKRRNEQQIARQVFYVGDQPMNMYEWANAFSLSILKKPVRVVPTWVVYLLAVTGSCLRKLGIGFPITLSRYKSMTTDNPAPMQKTFAILGNPPYQLEDGIRQTTEWLELFWKKQKENELT